MSLFLGNLSNSCNITDLEKLFGEYGKCTIDRIDVNGNYEPSNCRWIDVKSQERNRGNNNFITYNNETHCISEWAEILGINYITLHQRICKYNWSIERAFTTSVRRVKNV